MPNPPTKDVVRQEVIRIISTFTTLTPDQLKESYVLKDPPMHMDDISLAFLAESLRGYAKQYDEDATVKATELRKAGLTVGGVVKLLQERTGAV